MCPLKRCPLKRGIRLLGLTVIVICQLCSIKGDEHKVCDVNKTLFTF